MDYSSSILLDSIVTLSWSRNASTIIVDRFLTKDTQIIFSIVCIKSVTNPHETQRQTRKSFNNYTERAEIQIKDRIGRVVGCLPLQYETFITTKQLSSLNIVYDNIWKQMDIREFTGQQASCNYLGELYFDKLNTLAKLEQAVFLQEAYEQIITNQKNHTRFHHIVEATTTNSFIVAQQNNKILRTWTDDYYLIEFFSPMFFDSNSTKHDVKIILSMKNRHGGYITADEYPTLVFYGVMCCVYILSAILWFTWCVLYRQGLHKIQFWISVTLIMGIVEKLAWFFVYDILNRYGYKYNRAIMITEILTYLQRTILRILVIFIALGYSVIEWRFNSPYKKVIMIGIVYFVLVTFETILCLNTNSDKIKNKLLISRILLISIDSIVYYWILTSLLVTREALRLKENVLKWHAHRHFTNTLIICIISSLVLMIWSAKSHIFSSCITDWNLFWINNALWHILSSMILLHMMFLFRPSIKNQLYTILPLLNEPVVVDQDIY